MLNFQQIHKDFSNSVRIVRIGQSLVAHHLLYHTYKINKNLVVRSDKTGGLTSTKVRTTSVRTTKVRTTNAKMTNVRSTRIITGKTNKLISSEQKMQNCNYRYPDKRQNMKHQNDKRRN